MLDDLTIADVIALPALTKARVVAGHAGLDRTVRGVNVMEVPDILDWVRPGELLLTTAYPLRDDAAGLEALVPRLHERGLSGIAIKTARYIDRIPDPMIQAADRLGFPLLELPADASFSDIIAAVLAIVLNVQSARLERSAAIHDRFTSIALSGGGLRQIAEALAEFAGRPVTILDAHGVVQWQTASDSPTGAANGVVAQPIKVAADHYGTILVADPGHTLAGDRLEAIEYAATVAALRQVQARAIAEADHRYQAVCLEELVTGHVTDRSILMEQAGAFQWDLAVPRRVVLMDAEAGPGGAAAGQGPADESAIRARLGDAARAGLGPRAIIWERSRGVAALVDAAEASVARDQVMAVLSEVERRSPGRQVRVGIGRVSDDPLALVASFREARRALAIGRWRQTTDVITVFDDLGVDRLLSDVPAAEVEAFCKAVLGRLEAVDAERGTDLVRTLEVFLATRNAAATARALYVHYNTVQNRLARIEELLGPYLDDPDRSLALALAVRLRRRPLD